MSNSFTPSCVVHHQLATWQVQFLSAVDHYCNCKLSLEVSLKCCLCPLFPIASFSFCLFPSFPNNWAYRRLHLATTVCLCVRAVREKWSMLGFLVFPNISLPHLLIFQAVREPLKRIKLRCSFCQTTSELSALKKTGTMCSTLRAYVFSLLHTRCFWGWSGLL